MKIIKNEIRPVGFCTLELSDAEIQTILGTFEDLQMVKNMPFTEIKGLRGDIYHKLEEILISPLTKS